MAEQHREKHLYLLFDDWHSGYSIRKVSLSRRTGTQPAPTQPLSSGSGKQDGKQDVQPVPQVRKVQKVCKVSLSRRSGKQPLSSGSSGKQGVEPDSGKEVLEPVPQVIIRMQALRGFPDCFTSAFGTKIVLMHHTMADDTRGSPMIDVQEQALISGPRPSSYYAFPIYFPFGDNRLFVLDNAFDSYLWTPEHGQEPWGCQNLPRPPFKRLHVSSYGMRSDGCILVSTTQSSVSGAHTFIFDTTKEDSVWKPYGNWVLPFTGRGHYDTSLEGFVGLSKDPETLGYLLYCSTTGTGLDTPRKKRTKEKVYNKNPAEGHISATLVHMRKEKFCLVECVSIDRTGQELSVSWVHDFKMPLGANEDDFVGGPPQGGHFMYRLKTFSLSYDPKGDCLKLKKCKTRCFSLPHEARIGSICMDPVAFWL